MISTRNNDLLLQNIDPSESFPVSFEQLETAAQAKMGTGAFGYVHSGAGREETLQKNVSSFSKYAIVPRFLNDVTELDTSVQLFGRTYATPLFVAPVGVQKIAHEDGEIATAQAAASLGIPFIQSTVSSYSIEEVKEVTGDSPKWFQLYWSSQNADISYSMVQRAEAAGYEAIVLTVDTVMLGWREEDVNNQYSPLMQGFGKANYVNDPVFMASLPNDDDDSIIQGIVDNIYHPSLSWKQVAELKKKTSLPILLKGILHPEDAKLAIENGIDGIIVSNHGGRQLDGVIASIDALRDVVEAVEEKIPVLFDSGIRRGSDVVKALALGADAVLVGRPFVYGLAVGGQQGVEKVLSNILQEMKVTISLSGFTSVRDLRNVTIVNR
ncbi:alpha-hydroxy-acid oxidizing protein [Sporosarcina sp. ACRSM]|uniref:alpha-hydroxy-acid oxidizing protein n=1 Tax=Sporosarcina sp. ACRSM TaxID=2918216 RepID=UPI001EF53F73|nr:alpha-hydroxy-acid oxidizing protein [Sporosarcina sp. ACRSM]MCG7336894.1 alpha-hydroxy-acid oxidizing protein [Sporosarcina sp. ACRSM]